jgi:Bifunctional DNA primase/polymerase, N-terminal
VRRPPDERTGPEVTTPQARPNVKVTATVPDVSTVTPGGDSGGELAAAALRYAAAGWPVFPCTPVGTPPPDHKAPLTAHGFKDASADPPRIRAWWRRWPDANIGIATGAPGPDVLDVDRHEDGDGFAAFNRLKRAGMLAGARALVRTRSGGLHAYYAGTGQACGRLPAHHLDFKARGGYVIAPPSVVGGRPYELLDHRAAGAQLDWQAVRAFLEPPRPRPARGQRPASHGDLTAVTRYLSGLKDGQQRWRQLHWAACRAAEAIAAGAIGEDAARDLLLEAARANGFTADHGEREAISKIDRGLRDGAR